MDTYKNKYDKALERARKNYDAAQDLCSGSQIGVECFKNTLTNIFPELKESEDERIRKEIIDFVKSRGGFKGDWIAWLEKQGECYISHDDEIMIEQLTEYFTTGRGLQNTNETVVEWLNDVKEKLEKQGEVESDNDDIEVEEKGIREAFNKIEDEKQYKQKPFDYKNQGTQNSHKFNIGDIISNGNVEFRIDNIVKNCVGQDCYFLVDVESEKNGTRYLTMCVRGKKTSHMGETTWLCEQVDKSFKKQCKQKPIIEMKSAEESLGIDSETYNEIVDECIYGEQKSQRMISAEAKEAMYDKPSDKVEPKFNVGDWVVYYRNDSSREVLQVYDIRDGRYYFTDNVHFSWSVKECDEKSHLWTIQDAKDGDVLACGDKISCPFIFHNLTEKLNPRAYCGVNTLFHFQYNNENCGHWCYSNEVRPATKEECDLLFSKMKEAGYEWNEEKKELKKISQRMISAEAKEAMYAKTAWSEEDEKMLVDAYVMLDWYKGNNWWTARRIKDWLETLKQRIGG